MKISILCIGPTGEKYLREGIAVYLERLNHHFEVKLVEVPSPKNASMLPESEMRQKEGQALLKLIDKGDMVVLLDEKGQQYDSPGLAGHLRAHMNASVKRLVYVVGGPFGFSEEVYARAQQKLSLSKLTFTHQMVRLFFVEQLYRAVSIIKGSRYHHS